MLTLMKSLPLAYNKDMQEDKEALFDAVDTVKQCLLVFAPMLQTARFNKARMAAAAREDYNATDLADYLAGKGLPFRDAHEVVGKTVLYCIQNSKMLEDLSLEEYRQFNFNRGRHIYLSGGQSLCGTPESTWWTSPGTSTGSLEEARQWLRRKLDEQV